MTYFVKATNSADVVTVRKFRTEQAARLWCEECAELDLFEHFLITTNNGNTLVTQYSVAGPLAYRLEREQ